MRLTKPSCHQKVRKTVILGHFGPKMSLNWTKVTGFTCFRIEPVCFYYFLFILVKFYMIFLWIQLLECTSDWQKYMSVSDFWRVTGGLNIGQFWWKLHISIISFMLGVMKNKMFYILQKSFYLDLPRCSNLAKNIGTQGGVLGSREYRPKTTREPGAGWLVGCLLMFHI